MKRIFNVITTGLDGYQYTYGTTSYGDAMQTANQYIQEGDPAVTVRSSDGHTYLFYDKAMFEGKENE